MGSYRLTLSVAVLALVAGCADRSAPAGEAPAGERSTVQRVNDGDTLTLSGGDKVRLLQIDAPELLDDCYGRAAHAALKQLVGAGSNVTLVRDLGLDGEDRYGRLLRYVFAGGVNVNVALVRRGAASPYFFRKQRGRYARMLLAAVEAARGARAGYWGSCPRAELNTELGSVTGRRR
ncbi:MAG: thermonuclease family protein [Gaiella sp.]